MKPSPLSRTSKPESLRERNSSIIRRHPRQLSATLAPIALVAGALLVTSCGLGAADNEVPVSATSTVNPNSNVEGSEHLLVSYVERDPELGQVRFRVTDSSARNASSLPPLLQRTILVKATYPVGPDNQVPSVKTAVRVEGSYHDGMNPTCSTIPSSDTIFVCIGFPRMNSASHTQYADIPNHPGDVSAVLDVIIANQLLVGAVDTERIWYEGNSMGAISGLYFSHPDHYDSRIRAVVAIAGFAPDWVPGFSQRESWDAGPAVLMINTMTDSTIPYELARRTVELSQKSPKLQLLTVFNGEHDLSIPCPERDRYHQDWIRHQIDIAPAPTDKSLASSKCAGLGVRRGGTEGYGAASALRPKE